MLHAGTDVQDVNLIMPHAHGAVRHACNAVLYADSAVHCAAGEECVLRQP